MNAEKSLRDEMNENLAALVRTTRVARQDMTKNANYHYAPTAPEKNG